MRNGLAVIIALVVVLATGIGLWLVGSAHVENVSTPPASVPDVLPTTSAPVDLSNPVPEIRVTSAASAPAPIVVNEPAIRGRVIDEFDAPIEDAAVTVYHVDTGPQRAFTDGAGVFAIGDLVVDRKYRVSAVKAHYNEAVIENVSTGSDEQVLVLMYTSTAVGRVVDESGKPVTRFDVVYLKQAIDNDALWKEVVRSGATSWQTFEHPEGRYEIAGIISGSPFSLGARAQGFEATVIAVSAAPPGEQTSPQDIVLKTDARIEGLVLSPQRTPLPSANIHLGADADGPIVSRTDGAGRFTLSGLGDVPIELTADQDAYLPETIRVIPKRGGATSVEIVLRQGGALIGRVTRGNTAAPGQTVLAVRLTEPRIQKQVTTDQDGRYRIEGLGTGTIDVFSKYALPETSPLRLQSQVSIVAGADVILNFDFPNTLGTLEGIVTANGNPVDTAEIEGTVDTPQGQTRFSTTANKEGFYRAENIVPGNASVTVVARSNDANLRRTVTAELRGGEVTRVDVDFGEAATLIGNVANLAAGEVGGVAALPGHDPVDVSTMEAILRLESIKAGDSDIDRNGQFIISGLEPGDYTIVALVFGEVADTGDDAIDSLRVAIEKITLPETGNVTITLTLLP